MENDGKRPEVWHLMAKPFSRFSWTVERRQDGRSTLTLTHLLPMINSLVLQSATKCYKYTTKFTKSSTAFESSTNLVKMIRKNSHHGGYSYSSASTFRRCSSIKSWKFAAGNKDQRKSIKCKSTCSYLHAGLHRTILALRHLPILVQNMSEISLAKHLMTSPACFSMFFHESFTTPFEHFWNFPFDLLALTGSHRLSATPSTSPLALWASPLAQLLDASWVSEFHRSQKLPTMRHYAISMPSVCHGPKNVQNTNWSSTFVLPVEVSTVPCEGMGLDSRLLLERSEDRFHIDFTIHRSFWFLGVQNCCEICTACAGIQTDRHWSSLYPIVWAIAHSDLSCSLLALSIPVSDCFNPFLQKQAGWRCQWCAKIDITSLPFSQILPARHFATCEEIAIGKCFVLQIRLASGAWQCSHFVDVVLVPSVPSKLCKPGQMQEMKWMEMTAPSIEDETLFAAASVASYVASCWTNSYLCGSSFCNTFCWSKASENLIKLNTLSGSPKKHMHRFGEKIMKCLEVANAISYSQTIESEFRNGYSRACSAKSKCETANNE